MGVIVVKDGAVDLSATFVDHVDNLTVISALHRLTASHLVVLRDVIGLLCIFRACVPHNVNDFNDKGGAQVHGAVFDHDHDHDHDQDHDHSSMQTQAQFAQLSGAWIEDGWRLRDPSTIAVTGVTCDQWLSDEAAVLELDFSCRG